MKTLLAVGCSFTNPNYVSDEHPEMDCSWPKWPEIVGKKLSSTLPPYVSKIFNAFGK